jgi:hypothetical protein
MKNIFVYYSAILIPIPLLVWVAKSGDSMLFTILLFTYFIAYRTLIHGWRLVNKKLMKWNEIWKLWIPWKHREFFKNLYFSY